MCLGLSVAQRRVQGKVRRIWGAILSTFDPVWAKREAEDSADSVAASIGGTGRVSERKEVPTHLGLNFFPDFHSHYP